MLRGCLRAASRKMRWLCCRRSTGPGNVRHLRNIMEWLLIMSPADNARIIEADMLPPDLLETHSTIMHPDDNNAIMTMPLREAREILSVSIFPHKSPASGGTFPRLLPLLAWSVPPCTVSSRCSVFTVMRKYRHSMLVLCSDDIRRMRRFLAHVLLFACFIVTAATALAANALPRFASLRSSEASLGGAGNALPYSLGVSPSLHAGRNH